jgi:hypothetical protein
MEILAVVVGQAAGLVAGREFVVELAMAAGIDLRQVAKVERTAPQEIAGIARQRPGRRKQAG